MKQTKKLLPWLALIVLLISCGGNSGSGGNTGGNGALPVIGSWTTPLVTIQDYTIISKLTVAAAQLTMATTCTGTGAGGGPVTVTVTTPATITSTQATIAQAPADQEQPIPGSINDCNASLPAGTFNYTVSGNTLTITVQGQNATQRLTRTQ